MPSPRTRTPAPAAEVRRFGMHPKLLLDVIRRQAGSLAKAILEGVMNSIDAGCTTCSVTIAPDKVVIEDDGKGITERQHIEQFFETFGQPHTEAEGKVYGTFRMGRGQMFAFGANVWRTGPFEMQVDVAGSGLDYVLKTVGKPAAGCKITIHLYEALLPGDLAETERTIKKWVEYAPGVVEVNGRKANRDPRDDKWDHVTDEAYVRLTGGRGALVIYNLGVHTMDLAGYRFGTGGVIVSRQQLRVNFARNDVQSDCPVWRKIKPLVDQKAQAKIKRKADLTDSERQRLADLITQGERPDGFYKLRVFTAVNGRHFSAEQLYDTNYQYAKKICAAPLGHRVGDKVFQQKLAFVLADETLQRFDATPAGIVDLVKRLHADNRGISERHRGNLKLYDVVRFEDLAGTISDTYALVDDKDLTVGERLWMAVAARCAYRLQLTPEERFDRATRKLVVGESEHADGWTDGENYVAIDRKFLRTLTLDVKGFTELGLLLAHEFCHDGPDTAEHVHSQEFYEAFHNRAWERLPDFVAACQAGARHDVKAAGKDLPKAFLRDADLAELSVRQLRGLLQAAEKAGHDQDEAAEPRPARLPLEG